jgi:hypothetical protein
MLSRFSTLGGAATDPYWNNVSFLLVGNGANNTNTNIKDSSKNNLAVTNNGSTVISTAVSPPAVTNAGVGTVLYNYGSNYLTIPYSALFNFTGDFTIESWAYQRAYQFVVTLIGNYNSWPNTGNGNIGIFAGNGSLATKYTVALNGVFPAITSTTPIILNAWVHIALVRAGNIITLYINGLNNGTYTDSATYKGTQNTIYIGTSGDGLTRTWDGYIYDLRITKGVARYTASFTPPPFPPTAAFPTS